MERSLDDIIKTNKGGARRKGGNGEYRGKKQGRINSVVLKGGMHGRINKYKYHSRNQYNVTDEQKRGGGKKIGGYRNTRKGTSHQGGLSTVRQQQRKSNYHTSEVPNQAGRSKSKGRNDLRQHIFQNEEASNRSNIGESSSANTITKLHISNLDSGVSESDIRELFDDFGKLQSASLHFNSSGQSLGTADVVFQRRIDATKALNTYNGVRLDGKPMNIQFVTSDTPQPYSIKSRLGYNGMSALRGQRI